MAWHLVCAQTMALSSLAHNFFVNDEALSLLLIDPVKPWQNVTNQSFNGKFGDEYLSAERCRNRLEAKVIFED